MVLVTYSSGSLMLAFKFSTQKTELNIELNIIIYFSVILIINRVFYNRFLPFHWLSTVFYISFIGEFAY